MGGGISTESMRMLDAAIIQPENIEEEDSYGFDSHGALLASLRLESIPEVEEEEDVGKHKFTALVAGCGASGSTRQLDAASMPIYNSTSVAHAEPVQMRSVLVTRSRDTRLLDGPRMDLARLKRLTSELQTLLQEISMEEYSVEQMKQKFLRKNRNRGKSSKSTAKGKQARNGRIHKKNKTERLARSNNTFSNSEILHQSSKNHWLQTLEVWQAQNGIEVKYIPTTEPVGEASTLSTDDSIKRIHGLISHHPDRIRVVTRLAAVLVRMNELNAAQGLWESTCMRCCKDFGLSHKATLTCYAGLGYVLLEKGQVKLAETACRRAFNGLSAYVGEQHPLTRYSRRLLVRIVHQLGLLKPSYFAEEERLLRLDLHAHVSNTGGKGTTRGHTLFAYYNLAAFCAHFGRTDEAIYILRVAINKMTTAMMDNVSTKVSDHLTSKSNESPPLTPLQELPKHEVCPYTLKAMALNKKERILDQIKRREASINEWENKIQATRNQGHHRSASFYETKVCELKAQINDLYEQEEERQQQEEARDAFAQRRLELENRAFDLTVLRRKREAHERAKLEAKESENFALPTENTNLDLLPQTWECVNLLVHLLKGQMAKEAAMSGGIFEEEEEERIGELRALNAWLHMRAEHERQSDATNHRNGYRGGNSSRGSKINPDSEESVTHDVQLEMMEQETMPPLAWGNSITKASFEEVDWEA